MKYFVAALLVVFVIIMRITPHVPNIAPLTAMALFSGFVFRGWFGFATVGLAALISDLLIGFYDPMVMIAVYLSYGAIIAFGFWLKKRYSGQIIALSALTSSLFFFVVTNTAVWASGWYPKTISGLLLSYTNGLPFLRNALIGDLFYTALFFGAYALVCSYKPAHKPAALSNVNY